MSVSAYSDEAIAAYAEREPSFHETYKSITKYLPLTDKDQSLWWHQTGPIFAELLSRANYDIHHQYQYLLFLGLHIVPMLGPFPDMKDPARYATLIGGIGALEFSHNFTKNAATIRMGVEPTTYENLDGKDVYKRGVTNAAIGKLESLGIGIDSQLYHLLLPHLTISHEEEKMLAANPDLRANVTNNQHFFALDLVDGKIIAKIYLLPILKAIASGTATGDIILNALTTIDTNKIFAKPLALVKEYISTVTKEPSIIFLSCDLVPFAQTRLKLYLSIQTTDLPTVDSAWTMGGRLADHETLRGLDYVHKLWKKLQIPEGHREMKSHIFFPGDPPTKNLVLLNYEMRPDRDAPQPKMYFPVVGLKDDEVAGAVVDFFTEEGWDGHASVYRDTLASIAPGIDLSTETMLQAWVSFAYTDKKGPYLTVYYR